MKNSSLLTELLYDYPEHLVATSPQKPPRVAFIENGNFQEISFSQLLSQIPKGDVLVLNDTQVLKRRVFAGNLEILFLKASPDLTEWEVLFPSRDLKVGSVVELPLGKSFTLIAKGRPQKIKTSEPLLETYFEAVAELPLPPYIQKARGERHNILNDTSWYQTAWAANPGSLAAPTASLHFTKENLEELKSRGVQIETLTLHVGLGTFLPVTEEIIQSGVLHKEFVEIPATTRQRILAAKNAGKKIWALGTTVTRSLESAAKNEAEVFETDLFITPGYEFKIVDRLMTNFHQPGSSLLSLVMAFAGKEEVKAAYKQAIEKEFKLFSYGDFSVWKK